MVLDPGLIAANQIRTLRQRYRCDLLTHMGPSALVVAAFRQ